MSPLVQFSPEETKLHREGITLAGDLRDALAIRGYSDKALLACCAVVMEALAAKHPDKLSLPEQLRFLEQLSKGLADERAYRKARQA